MRVNIYTQELTNDVTLLEKSGNNGEIYSAIMFAVDGSPRLHDDDGSGVTFWLPKSIERRECFARTLETAAGLIRNASSEKDIRWPIETLEIGKLYTDRDGGWHRIIYNIGEDNDAYRAGWRFQDSIGVYYRKNGSCGTDALPNDKDLIGEIDEKSDFLGRPAQ